LAPVDQLSDVGQAQYLLQHCTLVEFEKYFPDSDTDKVQLTDMEKKALRVARAFVKSGCPSASYRFDSFAIPALFVCLFRVGAARCRAARSECRWMTTVTCRARKSNGETGTEKSVVQPYVNGVLRWVLKMLGLNDAVTLWDSQTKGNAAGECNCDFVLFTTGAKMVLGAAEETGKEEERVR